MRKMKKPSMMFDRSITTQYQLEPPIPKLTSSTVQFTPITMNSFRYNPYLIKKNVLLVTQNKDYDKYKYLILDVEQLTV